jgi:hypothetical protein
MSNRYYDPVTGRFRKPDEIGIAGGDTNLYRYVRNNPANAVDPTGFGPEVGLGYPVEIWKFPGEPNVLYVRETRGGRVFKITGAHVALIAFPPGVSFRLVSAVLEGKRLKITMPLGFGFGLDKPGFETIPTIELTGPIAEKIKETMKELREKLAERMKDRLMEIRKNVRERREIRKARREHLCPRSE